MEPFPDTSTIEMHVPVQTKTSATIAKGFSVLLVEHSQHRISWLRLYVV